MKQQAPTHKAIERLARRHNYETDHLYKIRDGKRPRNKIIHVRIDPFLYDLLMTQAFEQKAAVAHYVRLIILDAIAEHQAAEAASLKTFNGTEMDSDYNDEFC